MQETHFICAADCRVLESDFNVFSAYSSHSSTGVSLLVENSLDADGEGGRLVVADVAVKSFKFRLIVVYAPNTTAERVSFFSPVGAIPGRFKAASLNGWLECNPWSQDK